MRIIVGVITFILLPLVIVVVAFKCAMAFVEESIR
jgi:hypothetical protein